MDDPNNTLTDTPEPQTTDYLGKPSPLAFKNQPALPSGGGSIGVSTSPRGTFTGGSAVNRRRPGAGGSPSVDVEAALRALREGVGGEGEGAVGEGAPNITGFDPSTISAGLGTLSAAFGLPSLATLAGGIFGGAQGAQAVGAVKGPAESLAGLGLGGTKAATGLASGLMAPDLTVNIDGKATPAVAGGRVSTGNKTLDTVLGMLGLPMGALTSVNAIPGLEGVTSPELAAMLADPVTGPVLGEQLVTIDSQQGGGLPSSGPHSLANASGVANSDITNALTQAGLAITTENVDAISALSPSQISAAAAQGKQALQDAISGKLRGQQFNRTDEDPTAPTADPNSATASANEAAGQAAAAAGAGGAGGGTFICTALHKRGLLDDATLDANRRFARTMSRAEYAGYATWAKPLTAWADRHPLGARVLLATLGWMPRAYMQEITTPGSSRIGRVILSLGLKVCARLGTKKALATA